ncbi:xanthine dehydrogenase family protein molybdopterin-binding subunit [Mucilaginibacter ginsenosidivorax]|uniref:Xanthine dehydrogenase family protein molybdopterin-binding subunit n=1 Tax=Mucilaginibacter ginsenosidivorax TaxID=862126 RepID=A0A5B8W2J7_9SPHI|nr:xanthine dehydrogenase family protein molybdopterin-binding subunit [Mucilaginibacter ginsenosidivorax]QEC77205.1 xanthine dehydrogenase family protein molybdopterin-binding subunit [Mucilaginibacter ginsenosidivorax]
MKTAIDKTMPSSAEGMGRVDGRLKVTGAAKYSAEYTPAGLTYGVLVGSTITKGSITAIDTKAASKAPGVLAIITHLNAPKVPGDQPGKDNKAGDKGALKVFYDDKICYNGQPVAIVIADTFERAQFAASLVKAEYKAEKHMTNLPDNKDKGFAPRGEGGYKRGTEDAWKTAPFKLEQEYIVPTVTHNPMELHAIIARWDADDKLSVWDKTQGVKDTQQDLARLFKLPVQNVQVHSQFVGGAFGSALRTWPHEVAAILAAKVAKRPVKVVLSRADMFTSVGYRPFTWQKMGIGATADGKLTGITHEAAGQTSTYEDFTEGPTGVSQNLYACPNVNTKYNIVPLDIATPTWMRGPGEATGSFALESALDELSYQLKIDPVELRVRNYAEKDPDSGKPFSSKFLKEAYELGANHIGWKNRKAEPGLVKENGWYVGYGMGSGMFGAYRDRATIKAVMKADGTLLLQSAVSDIGPGTGTAMVLIAAEQMKLPAEKIRFELGDSSLPNAPTQGGSATTASVGSAVYKACADLKEKFQKLVGNGGTDNPDYPKILKEHNLASLDVTTETDGGNGMQTYAMNSWSVHFVKVLVNAATGVVKIDKVACVADCGRIISPKTARSQVIGGAIGGLGMALMEESVIDHRYGSYINNNFADYHVPVNADIPQIDALFVNKPDPVINPMGAKGMAEIALIGMAAAVANAVYNASGKRVRELPITPDKVMG